MTLTMISDSKMSIAYAVMQHLVESIRCQTLFITHYPLLAVELGKKVCLSEDTSRHFIF